MSLTLQILSRLISSVDHNVVVGILQHQRAAFMPLSLDVSAAPAAYGGIKHIDYLIAHWMPVAMWKSWSEWGRVAASTILNIPIEGVIPTTNHLESFNSILKRKHLPAHLCSGHRLRFDSLIHILITQILPGIYRHRKAQREYRQWLETRFRAGAGGENLPEVHKAVLDERALNSNKPVCWWEADGSLDGAAQEILNSHRLSVSRGKDTNTFVALCAGNPKDGSVTTYAIEVSRSGFASCTCPDFLAHGGACKHLRATRLIIDYWVCTGYEAEFYYPISRAEGEQQLQLRSRPTGSGGLSIQSLLNPPDVSPPLIAWNPTVIQTLRLDPTTLDDQEDGVEGLVSGGSDLSEDDSEIEISRPHNSTLMPTDSLQLDSAVCTSFLCYLAVF